MNRSATCLLLFVQAYIHGSDQCHFVVAVIVPEVNHFNKWCQDKGLADISSNLYQTPIVKSLFLSDVDSFCLETKLKEFELVRLFLCVAS